MSKPDVDSAAYIALFMGLAGLAFCPFFSPAAWIYSNTLLSRIRSGGLASSNYTIVLASKIIGVVGTLLAIAVLVVVILFFSGIVGLAVFKDLVR